MKEFLAERAKDPRKAIIDALLERDAQSLLLSTWHLAQFINESPLADRFQRPILEDASFLALHEEMVWAYDWLYFSPHEHEPKEILFKHLDTTLSLATGQQALCPLDAVEPDFIVNYRRYRKVIALDIRAPFRRG